MPTLPSPDTPATDKSVEETAVAKRNKLFKSGIQACKAYKRKLIKDWSTNVDYRRGKPFATQSDEDRVAVPLDAYYTKKKQASLFSQIPAVRVNHPPQTQSKAVAPWLHNYEQRINDVLLQSGIEAAMDECLPDCINAAGFGVIVATHEALTEDVEVPTIDMASMPPQMQQAVMQSGMMPDGTPIPMEVVPRVTDHRYIVSRVSPADFLWPINFNQSDFDKSPWVGRTGKLYWPEAQRRWKLDESKKNKYIGGEKNSQDSISSDTEKDNQEDSDEYVTFDEIFYRKVHYDQGVKKFAAIHHLIFINGEDKPVVDEPWEGQKFDEQSGELIGALIYPIRVLTLTYITDDAIPPSDSAIGRPQVNEINKARTQMILQREHSLPIRTVDVNRIDQTVLYNLMKGVWQGMIPVQGNGQNVITEVSRSSFPQENFTFDRIAKFDLSQLWSVGQEPTGADVETKGEADVIAADIHTVLVRERAKVGKFFCGIAEVVGGLIAIYDDPNAIGEGFTPAVSRTLAYSILADSTVVLDSNQRVKRLVEFVNFFGKTGWLNLEPILKEAASLAGLDPNMAIRPPEPKPPAEPNISLRLTGTEDLMSPMSVALMIKSGQAPTPEQIEQAKQLIETAVIPPVQQIPQFGPDGKIGPAPVDQPVPDPAPPPVGEANASWSAFPKVNQRILGEGEGGTQ